MKIITQNGIAKYTFSDDVPLKITTKNIICPDFIIGDLNSLNSVLSSEVTDTPGDYRDEKYRYNGIWSANVDYKRWAKD